MEKNKIVIYGTGLQAEQVWYFFKHYLAGKVVAFTVDKDFYNVTEFRGLPVIPFETIEEKYPPGNTDLFVAIGPQYMNLTRQRIYKEGKKRGYGFADCKLDNSIYPDLKCGKNAFIHASKIAPFVSVKENVFLQNCNIGHHTRIEENVFINSVTMGGAVVIGKNAFIGLGAVLGPKVHIGAYSFIGMGCIVNQDTKPYSVLTSRKTKERNINSLKLKLC